MAVNKSRFFITIVFYYREKKKLNSINFMIINKNVYIAECLYQLLNLSTAKYIKSTNEKSTISRDILPPHRVAHNIYKQCHIIVSLANTICHDLSIFSDIATLPFMIF